MSTDSRRAARVVWNRSDAKCIVHNIIITYVCFVYGRCTGLFYGLQYYSVNPRLKTCF